MDYDRDMAIVNQTFTAETPDDWKQLLQNSRTKPEAYNFINMTSDKFLKFTEFLKPQFSSVCLIQTLSIRELQKCTERAGVDSSILYILLSDISEHPVVLQ